MIKSYQQEIPQSRVNITLDVQNGGNKSQKELPMKMLMLGDFSNGKETKSLAKREKISINKHNFNQVLSSISPQVSILVADKLQNDGDAIPIRLEFKEFADFRPEKIVENVPKLKKLLAMRNLLKDLKACIIDNQTFRKELEKIMRDSDSAKNLQSELNNYAPIND